MRFKKLRSIALTKLRSLAHATLVNFERSGFIMAGGSPDEAERIT